MELNRKYSYRVLDIPCYKEWNSDCVTAELCSESRDSVYCELHLRPAVAGRATVEAITF
ncbi:MAG: hypothetical protein LBR06_08065 [Bacteroidales bacterium]|nr:hypothetical protein [Bacteroidales bacterium]